MTENNNSSKDILLNAPDEIHSNPALLFLFYRIEQILGIKAGEEALKNLNEYIEKTTGASFTENPASYEYLLTSREQIFEIAKFLTVNETYFFREEAHFELLSSLLPELAQLGRPLQICSAASSIGCEAYSIAMLLDYNIKKGLEFEYSIDAFDISLEAVETAKNGRYTLNTIRTDGKKFNYILDLYLNYENNEFLVSDKIKRKVRFFPHNIMRGIDKRYDIIFFRNALIYLSSRSRFIVLNNLSESLFSGGLLFLGTTETSSIEHPLFSTKNSHDVFYFQKITGSGKDTQVLIQNPNPSDPKHKKPKNTSSSAKEKKEILPKQEELSVIHSEITELLKIDEGKLNAENVYLNLIEDNLSSLSGSMIAAAALYFLNTQDLDKAGFIISYLETRNTSACQSFLKGELSSSYGNNEDALKYYTETCFKDKCFWPAFYRIAILSSEGNRVRYEYKIKKTIESIELSLNPDCICEKNYECFIGGFSSEYFLKILEKKLI